MKKKKVVKKSTKKITKAKPKPAPKAASKARGNPHLAKLKRKAEKLKQHLKSAGEDRQSLVRLKQLETQIGG